MFKKLFVITFILLLFSSLPALAAETDIAVYLDGELQEYTAMSRGGDILLPLRNIATDTGRDIQYTASTKEIQLAAKHSLFTLRLGSTKVLCDGEEIAPLAAAPYNHRGRVHLPLTATAELLGLDIIHNQEQGQVEIYTDFLYEKGLAPGDYFQRNMSLYRVSRSGERLEIMRMNTLGDYIVKDGYCYIFGKEQQSGYRLYTASVYEAYDYEGIIKLGDPQYSYSLPPEGWTITDEGVKLIGYTNGTGWYFGEYMAIEESRNAVLESYGYYLLDLNGNGQQLLEHLEWPHTLPPLIEAPDKKDFETYLNGEKQEISAIIEDDTVLLPARAVCNLLGAEIAYIDESKEIQITADNFLFTVQMDSTEALRNGEELAPLEAAPYVLEGTAYLPISFLAEALGADIVRNQEASRVDIYTEFEYEKIWAGDDGIMSSETIWQVSPSGNRKEIFNSWQIADYVIHDGYCYVLINSRFCHGHIYKVSLINPQQQIMLGSSEFSYGYRLYDGGWGTYTISDDNSISTSDMQKLEITEDGIAITGFLADGQLGYISKNDAVTQSYGRYLLDLEGNGQQLIEMLEAGIIE